MLPFDRLVVWRRAHSLALTLLKDPFDVRDFRCRVIAAQAWRASCSVGANIAEGSGSDTEAQFARYLGFAIASATELENHLRLATDAEMLPGDIGATRVAATQEIKRMLWALRKRVRAARLPTASRQLPARKSKA